MLDKHIKIIDEIKYQMWSLIDDDDENKIFIMDKDFIRFRFKTNDNLPYNKKNNVPVCVISIKKYVDFNARKRQESSDEFNKNLCKWLNNCIYAKSIENQRKRINVKLINVQKIYQR